MLGRTATTPPDNKEGLHPVKIRRALISVSDKNGLSSFAHALHEEFGINIISTGGTAAGLADAGVPVIQVESMTGFPEMMDGRVKTLHPHIHGGILADRDNAGHVADLQAHGIESIDMVVVNLYPFENGTSRPDCTLPEAVELIDIGGPCLLRAAAKNHRHVAVVCDPRQYASILAALRDNAGSLAPDFLTTLAREAFARTAAYDKAIDAYLSRTIAQTDSEDTSAGDSHIEWPSATPVCRLRYGENPHQQAAVYSTSTVPSGLVAAQCDETNACSYNNLADADAAWALCADLHRSIDRPNCVFVKHNNACGIGLGDDPIQAYERAYLGDYNAAMGGVLACSFEVDAAFADQVMNTFDRLGKTAGAGGFFVEVWLAPGFAPDATQLIRDSKAWGQRVRLLRMASEADTAPALRSVSGGVLVQDPDRPALEEHDWEVKTSRPPSDEEWQDLRLAWLACKHTRSNAISICRRGALLGNGAGQMSRVMSCRLATWLAKDNGHAESLLGASAASDGFFPFSDGPRILADAGVTALIQPGGSKRDEETTRLCEERNIALVHTGLRHFRH